LWQAVMQRPQFRQRSWRMLMRLFSIVSAPLGHALTHFMHLTQRLSV
jgi:hypothetical protein